MSSISITYSTLKLFKVEDKKSCLNEFKGVLLNKT